MNARRLAGLLVVGAAAAGLPGQEAAREDRDEGYWRWMLERLAAEEADVRENAFESLVKEGEPAATAALAEFEESPVRGRRLRAGVVVRIGGASALERVLGLLGDPDPGVRVEWARFLSRLDLPRASLDARRDALVRLVDDADPRVASVALEGLGRFDDEPAARALARFAGGGDATLRDGATRVLAGMTAGRPHLLPLALDAEGKEPARFAVLLGRLGEALPHLEARGLLPDPGPALALFARHWADSEGAARERARLGFLGGWVPGLQELGRAAQAAKRLESLAAAVGSPPDLLESIVLLHLRATRDDRRAAEFVERLATAGAREPDAAARAWLARVHALRGVIALLDGRAVEADAAFARAIEVNERLEREDAPAVTAKQRAVDLGVRIVRLRTLRAVNAFLAPGTSGLLDPEKEMRAIHDRASAIEVPLEREAALPLRFDEAMDGQPGAREVLTYLLVARGRGKEAGEALRRLCEGLSRKSLSEFPWVGKGSLDAATQESPRERRQVSRLSLDLAIFEEEVNGDLDEALRILDRLLGLFERRVPDPNDLAEVLWRRGSLLSRQRRGDEAKSSLEKAARIYEALADQARREGYGAAIVRNYERQLASTLVSLAVNENVVRGDGAASLEYRRRAIELDPRDFQRVFYACQLARDGRADEARRWIENVAPGVDVNYNLACTHALLGDRELAFEYLRRNFEERASTGRALTTDRAWAWKDPDLGSLRGDPRFAEIVGSEPPASKGP